MKQVLSLTCLLLLMTLGSADAACRGERSSSTCGLASACTDGYKVKGLCPGGNDVVCCIHSSDSRCLAVNGTCLSVSSCARKAGSSLEGLCQGASSNIKCCVKPSSGAPTTAPPGGLRWTPVSRAGGILEARLDPHCNASLVAFAGYSVTIADAANWAAALSRHSRLNGTCYRAVYAVRGPHNASYSARGIDVVSLAEALLSRESSGDPRQYHVVAHSSGSFVAHDLFHQLFDAQAFPSRRVAYWNLDGGISSGHWWTTLDAAVARHLLRVVAAWGRAADGLASPNAASMQRLSGLFPGISGGFQVDAASSGCLGKWCVHMTMIRAVPFDKYRMALVQNYGSVFDSARPLQTSYFDY